jgi:hypothetical protein
MTDREKYRPCLAFDYSGTRYRTDKNLAEKSSLPGALSVMDAGREAVRASEIERRA